MRELARRLGSSTLEPIKSQKPGFKPLLSNGSTCTAYAAVYSRQLKIVEYGDNFTEGTFQATRQYTFVLVKPGALQFLGKVVNAAIKSGFAVAKVGGAVCKLRVQLRPIACNAPGFNTCTTFS
jgi:hypothetical protein